MEKRKRPLESLVTSLHDVYRDRKILVTGHTGFKGAWLSLWLNRLGAEVIGFSLEAPTQPNLFESIGLADLICSIHGDILQLDSLKSAIVEHQPEIIFHLAAQPIVRASYKEPLETYAANLFGTINILEAIRTANCVHAGVFVTTDKCYRANNSSEPYRETDPLGGNDPYSSSKACAELAVTAWRHSFFHPQQYQDHRVSIATVRAGNVIGGGDWGHDRLVPDCIRAVARSNTVELRNPSFIRPWQYVLEPLYGYLLIGARLLGPEAANYSDAYNFGPSHRKDLTVLDLVKVLLSNWGSGGYKILDQNAAKPHEDEILRLNSEKAQQKLGWKQTLPVENAIRETASWYKRYYDQPSTQDMRAFSIQQIEHYCDRIAQTKS